MADLEQQLESFLKTLSENKGKDLNEDQLKKLEYFGMKGLEEGRRLEDEGKYADAVFIYAQVIEIFQLANKTLNSDYIFRRAYSYSELREDDKAIADYQKYLELCPKDAVAPNNLALLYCKKGMHDKEFELLDTATRLDPLYESPHRNMAVCYRDRKKFKEGLDPINKAIGLNPTKAVLYSIKGEILEGMQKTEEAVENYEKALQFNNQDEYSRNQLKKLKAGDEIGGLTTFNAEKPSITFNNVVGLGEVKGWCKTNMLLPLTMPDMAKKYKKGFGGGMILYGPPGCGKTYFCSALAGEGKINFIRVKLSGIFDMWLGNTEKNIANLFKSARKNKPCIIFIDELDALGGKRTGGAGERYLDQAVNQILMELTELEELKEEIFVIGATNAPWNVDDALKRSGRLGKFVYIAPPDREMKKALFKMYLASIPSEEKIDFDKLARLAENFSVTDIKSVCEEAIGTAFEEACASGAPAPVTMNKLVSALKNERSDLLEWYNTATKMISEIELNEFYPDLYEDIVKVRKGGKEKIEMFR